MLEAKSLTKRYGDVLALDGLDLKVKEGEVFCLLGANGAGKTTTIHLFLHFVEPTGGQAFVDGREVAKNPLEARRLIAYIPEQVNFYSSMTGTENLGYFSALAGFDYAPGDLSAFLRDAGLQDEAHGRPVGTYSKGMRQKVGIALALSKRARALMLDEPTSGLDPKASNEFSLLLRKLGDQGIAVLMATHDLFRAKESGHRVGIMREGKMNTVLDTEKLGHSELEKIYLDHMAN
ncbi:ABC transporter ATP-binding protein [bacterium]|nr:ABC transporter ATP-binding protein [bacterium]